MIPKLLSSLFSGKTIPKIIHQIWIGPLRPPLELMQTWKEMHPDWKYILWDNDAIAKHTFRNQRQIDASQSWAGKSDIMRYELLYEFGGVFSDADGGCLRPLDDFLLDNDSFAAWEQERLHPGLIANGTIGATKGNRLMGLMIDELERMPDVRPPDWKSTGPVFLTRMVEESRYDKLTVYPSHYFYPVHWTGMTYHGNDRPYLHQYWGSTIKDYDTGVTKRLIDVPQQLLMNARKKRIGEAEKAAVLYDSVCEETETSSPLHCMGLLGSAQCLRRIGRSSECFTRVDLAFKLFPAIHQAAATMALAYWERGDYAKAMPLMESVLANPEWEEPGPEFPYTKEFFKEALGCCKNELRHT